MTINAARESLYRTYGKHGVTEPILHRLLITGTQQYNLTVAATYNSLRLLLGEQFNEPEYFSVAEIAEMLKESEHNVLARIDRLWQGQDIGKYTNKNETGTVLDFPGCSG